MNKTYLELVEEARKKKLKETIKCKKELAKLYTEAYKDIAGKINATNPNIWAVQYQEELRKRIEKLNPALLKSIQGYIQNAASYGVAPEQGLFMNIQGAKAHEIMANLAKIPQQVAHELMEGKFYQDGAGLSARIWKYSKQDQKGVDYIIQQGLLQKKSTLELAKDLEKYLDPSAKKDFEWRKVYPNAGNKTIDFNAFRLASTSITHAYQLATIRAAKENPFAEGLKWHSALSTRTCDLCRSRHGQVFKIDEVPLDHPLGLCTTYSVITKSMEEIAEELKKGVYGVDKSGNSGYNKNIISYKQVDKEIEKELKKRSNKIWKNKLLGSEKNAIIEFSGDHYGITNRYLRNANLPDDDVQWTQTPQRVKELDRVLSKNILGDDLILYRGVSYEEFNYWKNSNVIDTYKSTTTEKRISDIFDDIYKIEIHAPKNTKGYYLGDNSMSPKEKEFLMHRNQKYKILKIEDTLIEVEFYE